MFFLCCAMTLYIENKFNNQQKGYSMRLFDYRTGKYIPWKKPKGTLLHKDEFTRKHKLSHELHNLLANWGWLEMYVY